MNKYLEAKLAAARVVVGTQSALRASIVPPPPRMLEEVHSKGKAGNPGPSAIAERSLRLCAHDGDKDHYFETFLAL